MIQIRRHRPDDVDPQFDAVRESIDNLSKWMPWCHAGYSRRDSDDWIASRSEASEKEQEFDFAIVDRHDRLLGCCGIHHIDWPNHTANLGYWVRSTACNRGMATRAVGELRAFGFQELDLHRLEILVAVENVASRRVAEKAGATKEALLRQRFLLQGRRHDAVLFAILRDETAPQ